MMKGSEMAVVSPVRKPPLWVSAWFAFSTVIVLWGTSIFRKIQLSERMPVTVTVIVTYQLRRRVLDE